jgi:putative endonuclease
MPIRAVWTMSKTDKKALGKLGEDQAVEYLIAFGYAILERNWRFGQKEIDILAQLANVLVVVEVKSSLLDNWNDGRDRITPLQEESLRIAALEYLEQNTWEMEIRFDLILVQPSNPKNIRHIKSVF